MTIKLAELKPNILLETKKNTFALIFSKKQKMKETGDQVVCLCWLAPVEVVKENRPLLRCSLKRLIRGLPFLIRWKWWKWWKNRWFRLPQDAQSLPALSTILQLTKSCKCRVLCSLALLYDGLRNISKRKIGNTNCSANWTLILFFWQGGGYGSGKGYHCHQRRLSGLSEDKQD